MTENWKTIIDYPNYKISNYGRVKRMKYRYRKGNYILKSDISNWGYIRFTLCKESKQKKFSAHRLVALHFIPNPDNLPEVNHEDGNKANNMKNNLKWMTSSQNRKHALATGLAVILKGEDCSWSKMTEKKVIELRSLYQNKTCNVKELSEKYSICKSVVRQIIYKEIWRHI